MTPDYTIPKGEGYLRLEADNTGFYGYIVLDDGVSRILLSESTGGKHSVVKYTKVPK